MSSNYTIEDAIIASCIRFYFYIDIDFGCTMKYTWSFNEFMAQKIASSDLRYHKMRLSIYYQSVLLFYIMILSDQAHRSSIATTVGSYKCLDKLTKK